MGVLVTHRDRPWRGLGDVEHATLEWVAWFNTHRQLEPLGYLPPAKHEEQYHRTQATSLILALNEPSLRECRGDSLKEATARGPRQMAPTAASAG